MSKKLFDVVKAAKDIKDKEEAFEKKWISKDKKLILEYLKLIKDSKVFDVQLDDGEDIWGTMGVISNKSNSLFLVITLHQACSTWRGSDESPEETTWDWYVTCQNRYVNSDKHKMFYEAVNGYEDEKSIENFFKKLAEELAKHL